MMMKNVLKALGAAGVGLWHNRRAVLVLMASYSALLSVLYLFISIREATVLQVLLTLIFAALAPALFFVLQAMIVEYARGETRPLPLLLRSLKDSSRLAIASLPLVPLAILFLYLLNKLQFRSDILFNLISPAWAIQELWLLMTGRPVISPAQVRQWAEVMLATLRFLIFGMALPILAIHLWSEAARDGLLHVFKRTRRTLGVAFRPQAVVTYAFGLIFFAVIPYFLLFSPVHAWAARFEIGVFVARLLLVFLFTILGWTITVSALRRENV